MTNYRVVVVGWTPINSNKVGQAWVWSKVVGRIKRNRSLPPKKAIAIVIFKSEGN